MENTENIEYPFEDKVLHCWVYDRVPETLVPVRFVREEFWNGRDILYRCDLEGCPYFGLFLSGTIRADRPSDWEALRRKADTGQLFGRPLKRR